VRLHFDWVQYRANFRDPVMVRATDGGGRPMALAEIATVAVLRGLVSRLVPRVSTRSARSPP
jgi:hypothetical protein